MFLLAISVKGEQPAKDLGLKRTNRADRNELLLKGRVL
jgi:hypothetical protein